jgi:formylglycine-generating enzyme required for sulfatase activity
LATWDDTLSVLEVGLHHEQQHQELIVTDILHAFAQNPTAPAYDGGWRAPTPTRAPGGFVALDGIHSIGHDEPGFCFDNERPCHEILLQPVRIARRLVTNGEWLDFIADGGYANPTLWLSDGWNAVQAGDWRAPGGDGSDCPSAIASAALHSPGRSGVRTPHTSQAPSRIAT